MDKNYQQKPYVGPEPDRTDPKTDILNWDNLIPIPPARPCRIVRARIKHIGPDKPSPVPEDDIPLSDLDDL